MAQFRRLMVALLSAAFAASSLHAAVQPVAQYNLKGAGGIRDTAAPAVLKDQAGKSPELVGQGAPKVMSNGPECRRMEYDSSIKFEAPDQCYSAAKNLVNGDNFVLEVWAYALKASDGGWHTIVANGNGGSGFLVAQNGDQWSVLVGGVGGTSLGKVVPETWTHLAVVKSRGQTSGWLNGKKICNLPGVGGGADNFSIGATAPGKEPFTGWIAEVRLSTFKAGAFDPAADFLMDVQRLKVLQAAEMAERAKLVTALKAAPGAQTVSKLDEKPAQEEWLIRPPATASFVQVLQGAMNRDAQILIGNGLVSRTFLVTDNSIGCISMRRSDKDIEFVRAVKPEVRLCLNGNWVDIGGLRGAADNAFITPAWFDTYEARPGCFRLTGMSVGPCVKPYEWHPKCNAPADIAWPANGRRVTFHFAPPADSTAWQGVTVDVHYEIYDGIPVIMKTFTLNNASGKDVVVTRFEGEYLAVQPSVSRLMHVESDYSFGAANWSELSSGLGIHTSGGDPKWSDYTFGAGTTRFSRDPDWGSMATLNPAEDLHLGNPENALLTSSPHVGPNWTVKSGDVFNAIRTFEILNDAPSDTERGFLAQRRMYRKVAPQTNEKLMEVHAPYSRDLGTLGPLLDQMAEMGFGMLQAPEHPGGFNYADSSSNNINSIKPVCDYARTKGIRVKSYQLMMASMGWGRAEDNWNCISPASGRPGSLFGQSACGASAWADMYYSNMWKTIEGAGMGGFAPDGPYHGDPCAAKDHPHHKGLEDSQWAQWSWMCSILREGQRRDLFLSIPDYYFLAGASVSGMGYREATDNIDIVLQTLIYRQYIFDATFHKTAQMGYCNLNTEVLHGGMEKNLDRYERALFTMLASGASVWVRGHRLYDGPNSRAMLQKWMTWYRKYAAIINGDIIHLKRPDGRGLDYYLHVNPSGREKGMLLVFNPLDHDVAQTLDIPLYYTGLTGTAKIREQEGEAKTFRLDGQSNARIPVTIPANGYTWLVIE